jgi:demethylmenaquinone methyltransferase/2-methoxy-6-polyprenyl-1,4-benzoquinol methylase/phosphoethanolamine N-methyltransferase
MVKRAAPVAAGHAIGWARWYDTAVRLLTLGRARAIREKTVTLACVAPGEALLEVGCGTGDVAIAARQVMGDAGLVVGIDVSEEMIAVARRKADRKGLAIDYRLAGVEELPFPDATFDVVLSSLMMHHLPDTLKRRGLTEIKRVLRPGGRLLIVDLKRPTGHHSHLALPLLVHRRMHVGMQDLPGLLQSVGFTGVESGGTGFGFLGFVRGMAPLKGPSP